MRTTTALGFLLLALLLALVGCAPSVRGASAEAAKGATPAAAESALDKIEDPQTQQRLAAVMASPRIQAATRELSSGVTQGVVEGLTAEAMKARIDELVGRLTQAIAASISEAVLSDANRAQLEKFASAVTASVFRSAAKEIPASVAPALHRAIVDELGPALRESMHKDLAPGMAALIHSPDVQAAFGETARQVAKQAVLGSNEGLAYLAEQDKKKEGGTPLGTFGTFFSTRTWLVAALLTALVLALPIAWLWHERSVARHYREDAERRNARAAALLGAMEASQEGVSSSRILAMLREQLLVDTTQVPPPPEPPMAPPPRPRPA